MIDNDILSLNNSKKIKGWLAIGVLVSHIAARITIFPSWLLCALQQLGYLSVSCFFFLSGFGIYTQYSKKGEKYICQIPKNKVLSIYFLNALLAVMYFVLDVIISNIPAGKSIILTFLFGDTIVNWYLQTQMVMYLGTYFAFVIAKRMNKLELFLRTNFIVVILFVIICAFVGVENIWYNTCLCYVLGMYYASCRKQVDSYLHNSFIFKLSVLGLAFAITWLFGNRLNQLVNCESTAVYYVQLLSKMLSSLLFPALLFLVLSKQMWIVDKLKDGIVTSFIEKLSLEIFVFQGLFLKLFHSTILYIENDVLYSILVIIMTLAMSLSLHKIVDSVLALPTKFVK